MQAPCADPVPPNTSTSTNLYWPSTSQYRHILTQNHQVLLISHHLVRHSSDKWIISLFYDSFMSHAQYTRSSSDSLLKGDRKRTFRALQAFPFTTSRVLRPSYLKHHILNYAIHIFPVCCADWQCIHPFLQGLKLTLNGWRHSIRVEPSFSVRWLLNADSEGWAKRKCCRETPL